MRCFRRVPHVAIWYGFLGHCSSDGGFTDYLQTHAQIVAEHVISERCLQNSIQSDTTLMTKAIYVQYIFSTGNYAERKRTNCSALCMRVPENSEPNIPRFCNCFAGVDVDWGDIESDRNRRHVGILAIEAETTAPVQ